MITYEHFARGFAALCEVFRITEPSRQLADLYFGSLQNLEPAEWTVAYERAVQSCIHFPRPVELLKFAGRGEEQRKREAAIAWEIVHAAMNKYDYTRSVDFGPLVNSVVRNMGGWIKLCSRTDLVWDRKRFEETYLLFAETKIDGRRGAMLRGQFDGPPVMFQIPGQPERRLVLVEADTPATELVRELADKKGVA